MAESGNVGREREFWDSEVPSLDDLVREYRAGPGIATAAMLDAIGDVQGLEVLDFACGGGVTSMFLAARGARMTALDLIPESVARCRELAATLGFADRVTAVAGELSDLPPKGFDAVVGRYALHHVDVAVVAPLLAARLRPGGRGAFLETFASNPVLRVSRRHLVGRMGVPRYGTIDEHPLTAADIAAVRGAFGWATTTVPQMTFLRMFDRQVLHFRHPRLSRLLAAVDDQLARWPRLKFLSYHQLVVCRQVGGAPDAAG